MSDYVIETRGLTKTYGEQHSVSNLSIHVRKGRIYGLLGRNGAGKTTTMRMLLGLTAPSSGDVKIFGKPLRGNEKNILPRIGSLIEAPGFYPNLTGTENLQIFADLRGLKSPKYIKSALEVVNLPYRDKKLFSQYSLGMKQRLAIALAVMHNPELLILDEPINGLDPIGIAEVRDFIRELCDATGKTILISSHILSEISLLADDIGIIDHGVLLEEESLEELEAKNGKYLRFTVSNAALAANLLQSKLGIQNIEVDSANELTVRDLQLDTGAAVRLFVDAGLSVSDAHLYSDFAGTEILFGGTTLEREAGSTLHITCSLSLESGKAAVFLRSGADDPTILLSESGEYDGTVEVDGTSTYIGVWGDQADGTVSIEIE